MNTFIEKAFSIEEDIKELEKSDQLKYVKELYHKVSNQLTESMDDTNAVNNARHHIEKIWMDLYKDYMVKLLEQKVKETPYCSIGDNPLLVVVEISDQFNVKIDYQWGTNIRFFFIQKFSNNTKVIVIKWSMIPIWLKNSSKFVGDHFEKEVTVDNWIDVIMDTAQELKQHSKEVISFCRRSSNFDKNGNKIVKILKIKAKIISLSKDMPTFCYMHHAKKAEQSRWDNSYFFHGSNGTYVENVNPSWNLNIEIMRSSFKSRYPREISIDVHEYITQWLMPKVGWKRISSKKHDKLNAILSGVIMDLSTYDTLGDKSDCDYMPFGYDTWNVFLDSIIMPNIGNRNL
ncbi:MAG: hypothetical protein IJ986_03330 [Bacteroidales bacterium]|nr:hypothetical protein [Bacteroidales bacterium]